MGLYSGGWLVGCTDMKKYVSDQTRPGQTGPDQTKKKIIQGKLLGQYKSQFCLSFFFFFFLRIFSGPFKENPITFSGISLTNFWTFTGLSKDFLLIFSGHSEFGTDCPVLILDFSCPEQLQKFSCLSLGLLVCKILTFTRVQE